MYFFLNVKAVHSRCDNQNVTFNFTKSTTMQEKQKRIKGSAIVDDEGLFVFTPYGTREGENEGMKLIYAHENGTVWRGKKHYALRLRVGSLAPLPGLTQFVRVLMHMHAAMVRDMREQKGGAR